MLWHLSCVIIYLFTCLLFCLLILYVYLRACLIFWSHFMLCLIVFCRQIVHVCNYLMFAGCWWCHFLVLCSLRQLWIRFFVTQTLLGAYFVKLNLLYLLVGFLMFFFDWFRAWFFCAVNQLATSICACSFSFFLIPLLIFLPPHYL